MKQVPKFGVGIRKQDRGGIAPAGHRSQLHLPRVSHVTVAPRKSLLSLHGLWGFLWLPSSGACPLFPCSRVFSASRTRNLRRVTLPYHAPLGVNSFLKRFPAAPTAPPRVHACVLCDIGGGHSVLLFCMSECLRGSEVQCPPLLHV